MKKILIITIIIFGFVFNNRAQNYYPNYNCYTIAAGKNATENKNVLVAHNEDDWGDLIVNIFKVPAKDYTENEQITLLNGTKINQVKHTLAYLWFETTKQKFGDYYLNEFGVSICSDACGSKEDTAIGNIGFYLRRIIAERAKSAKQGVKIAGKIISQIGYESSGRTYCIADSKEIWMLSVVKGKHWIAERVPNDMVAIIPNYYTIENVNLQDTNNFLGSSDIIDYAEKRGWYNPQKDKNFSFKKAYSATQNLYSIGNIPRHWSGINYLSEKEFNYGDNLPFAFKPKKNITKNDLQKILSSHYENTDFETNYKIHKNPHKNVINRICNAGTKFSIVTEFHNDRPADNAYIVWWAPLNPCINPYIPIAYGIKEIPKEYQSCKLTDALKRHFDNNKNTFEANPEHAYNVFNRYNTFVNNDYEKHIILAKKQKENIEKKAQYMYNIENVKKDSQVGRASTEMLKILLRKEKDVFRLF